MPQGLALVLRRNTVYRAAVKPWQGAACGYAGRWGMGRHMDRKKGRLECQDVVVLKVCILYTSVWLVCCVLNLTGKPFFGETEE